MTEHATRQRLFNRLNLAHELLIKSISEQSRARQEEALWRIEIEAVTKELGKGQRE